MAPAEHYISVTAAMLAVPLVQATRPRTSLGTLFSDVEVASLRAWLRSAKGPALATAASGTGLTTLVELLAREAKMDIVRVGAGTPRVRAFLAAAGSSPVTVTLRRKLIVVDEIDAGGDASPLAEALAFAKTSPPLPVLFVGKSMRSQKPHEFAKAWPRFAFARPPASKLAAYLASVAAKHGVQGLDVAELAKRCRGDVRSAIMAMDMHRRAAAPTAAPAAPAAAPAAKDEAEDGLDLVEAILKGDRGATVRDARCIFSQVPAMASMGLFENYADALGKDDVASAARVAAAFSAADVLDAAAGAHQAWDALADACAVASVAAPAAALARATRKPKAPKVTKFGTAWSKAHNASAKTKHVRALAAALVEAGGTAMGPCDLAGMRGCARTLLARSLDEFVAWWRPLGAAEALALARLDPRGGSCAWYKQSLHVRLKKALA